MAVTTIQANNKLVQYRKEINREWVRENMFFPYMGDSITSIIRTLHDTKKGGEQINIPLVTSLTGQPTATGVMVGNEERIDNYGQRVFIDWARHAVVTNDAEEQKDSADVFGEAKPLLGDWAKDLQRDEIIQAMMAIPSESAPVGLGSANGQRVNGILYEAATAAERNTWNVSNSDRILYGATTANANAVHATALANVGPSPTDDLTAPTVALAKYLAKNAVPKIRPWKTNDGREYFVMFTGSLPFRDLKTSLATINKDARPRETLGGVGNATNNPIFQDGDQIYDGVIVREVPEIDAFSGTVWTSLLTAGAGGIRVHPFFLCGQSAVAMPWGQMYTPTIRKEDDYQFVKGVGVKMCYGISKIFKKHPQDGTPLKQWGMVTGFVSASAI